MVAGEVDRDKPRGAEAALAGQQDQPQPEQQAEQVRAFIAQARLMLALAKRKARRKRPRKTTKTRRLPPMRAPQPRKQWRDAATDTARLLHMPALPPAPKEPPRPIEAARIITGRPVRVVVQPQAEDAAIDIRAPLLAADDIDRACTAEVGAIMQDFGRRLAGARSPSERRAIKTARKSAIAAARQKAKLLKAGRRGANAAARQRAPRRQHRAPKPRR
jgi:hypothetical protein